MTLVELGIKKSQINIYKTLETKQPYCYLRVILEGIMLIFDFENGIENYRNDSKKDK